MVAYGGRLAPYRFPGLVKGRLLRAGDGEAIHEVGLIHSLAGVLVFRQFQSQPAGFHHSLSFVSHLIVGNTLLKAEGQQHIAIRRFDRLCQHHTWQHDGEEVE